MEVMQKIKSLWILFWKKCSFLHHHRKVLLKLSKCILLNASGICKFYTCKKSPFWKQSSNVRHFCPTGPMDPIFHIWAVVTYTKAWGKNQGDKWLFTFCQKNEPKMMLGLSSTCVCPCAPPALYMTLRPHTARSVIVTRIAHPAN